MQNLLRTFIFGRESEKSFLFQAKNVFDRVIFRRLVLKNSLPVQDRWPDVGIGPFLPTQPGLYIAKKMSKVCGLRFLFGGRGRGV